MADTALPRPPLTNPPGSQESGSAASTPGDVTVRDAAAAQKFRRLEYIVVASIVCFIILIAVVALITGAKGVIAKIGTIGPRTIAILLSLSLINYAVRAWRWQWFAKALAINVPPLRNLLYFIAGFAMTTTPAKAGEALRVWLLERCHGYRYERSAPLFLIDRIADTLAVFIICLLGVGAFSQYRTATLIAAVFLILLTFAFMRPRLLHGLVNFLYRSTGRRRRKLFARLRTGLRKTSSLFTFRLFGYGMILSLVGWMSEVTAFYLLLSAMGQDVSLQEAMFIFTFAMIAGTITLIPGGLVGTEATMLLLLGLIDVPSDSALAATAIIRLTTLWFATLLGFIALPFAMRLARRGCAKRLPARALPAS